MSNKSIPPPTLNEPMDIPKKFIILCPIKAVRVNTIATVILAVIAILFRCLSEADPVIVIKTGSAPKGLTIASKVVNIFM